MAKRKGVYKGGKPRLDRVRVKELADNGVGPAAIARELGMARSSVYRLLEEAGSARVRGKMDEVSRRSHEPPAHAQAACPGSTTYMSSPVGSPA